MSGLDATISPVTEPAGEAPVLLRVVNTCDEHVDLPDPDLGRPADELGWALSLEAYRAAQLVSFGLLTLDVADESGSDAERVPVPTWSTPLVGPPVSLAPGESLDVVIPLGPFFVLAPGTRYRVRVEYGAATKVRAEGVLEGPPSTR